MKCPKCGYLGFEDVDRCRNCGYEFALSADPPPIELRVQPDEEDLGSFGDPDLQIEGPAERPVRRMTFEPALDLDRMIGAPDEPDLPLFARDSDAPARAATGDDAPLVTSAATPRPPLAVRRATPALPRVRQRSPRPHTEPRLDLSGAAANEHDTRVTQVLGAPSGDSEPAAAGRRLLAASIDVMLLATLDALVLYFTLRLSGLTVAEIGRVPPVPFLAFLLLLNGGYLVALTAVSGQTIGKMAMGLQTVDADGGPVDFQHALLRTIGYLASLAPLGLGFLPALGGERRTLHDRLAGTRVVRRRD